MTDGAADGWSLPWGGGCRCGALRFRVGAPPIVAAACHCRGCQRMTGGAFSLSLILPESGFAVVAGETVRCGAGAAAGAVPPASGIDHRACPVCASWAFTRIPEIPGMVNLRATLLDDPSWVVPFVETCAAEALPWARTPAAHSFDGFPPVDAWARLSAAYAAEGARPR